jgi:hypothetical protein
VDKTRSCKYSSDAPDDEQTYRSKHVEQSMKNKLFKKQIKSDPWRGPDGYIRLRLPDF